jgi:hypothetical protein
MDRVVVSVGAYEVIASSGEWPELMVSYRAKARLAEDFPSSTNFKSALSFFAVSSKASHWPELVVTQEYEPAGYGFNPGLLIVPETSVVFIGAGERLLAYRLTPAPERLWEDRAFAGFWSWSQHGDVVLMSAEVDIVAYDLTGEKLWSEPVEPPWTYTVEGDRLELDIMGEKRSLSLTRGR